MDARWKPYVFQDDELQRRYYELCVLDKLRDSLRSGDIWVEGSEQFRHLKSFLIPDKQWQTMLDADVIPIAVPCHPLAYLRARADGLHEQLQRVDEGLANGDFEEVEWVKDRLKIVRTTLDVPDDMRKVRDAVYKLLPRIRITDLLFEVDATVGFTQLFTHLRTDEAFDNSLALCTTLLAGTINLGIEKMALTSHHTNYDRLAWIADWFIRDDIYAKALAQLTHFQMSNPFAYYWGSGTHSSSDAQYFPTGGFQSAITSLNPYYGKEAGNVLSRAVCIYRLGRIHDRSLQDQQYRASALNLIVSAITVWNTIYIEKAVEYLRNKGWEITDKHLEHLTPLGWEHISLTGDYIWNPNISTSLTNLRGLRT